MGEHTTRHYARIVTIAGLLLLSVVTHPTTSFAARDQAPVQADAGFAGLANLKNFLLISFLMPALTSVFSICTKAVEQFVFPKIEELANRSVPPRFVSQPRKISPDPEGSKPSGLVMSEETRIEVLSYVTALTHAAENDLPLPNLLVYGPTGTGKSALLERVINELDASRFVMMTHTGAELAEHHYSTLGHAFTFLNQAPTEATWYNFLWHYPLAWLGWRPTKRVVWVVDEAEEFLKAKAFGQRTKNIQTVLQHTGHNSPYFAILAATNFIEKIEPAVFRRFNAVIEMPPPGPKERRGLFNLFLDKTLRIYWDKGFPLSLDSEIETELGKSVSVPEDMVDSAPTTLVGASKGFSGAQIEVAVQKMTSEAQVRGTNVTLAMALRVLANIKAQAERLEENQRKAEATRRADEREKRGLEAYGSLKDEPDED